MPYTTIKKPSDYFNTKLYTGNGSTQSITGVNFQPDFAWIKNRTNVSGYGHRLLDSIRGATKELYSNTTGTESTVTDGLTSFDTDGFSLGANAGVNNSGDNFVAWNWLASNTTASNTDGSITSTVSANTTSGFSIVSYTGNGTYPSTIGHGLGVAPKMIIIKPRNLAYSWIVYNENIGNNNALYLEGTNASSGTAAFNSTSPTSSVFTVNDAQTNQSGGTQIAYCFAEKQGFSKFGSYTGNGNADGTFVYTGFKPAFVIIKNINTATSWEMIDNKRAGYNDFNYRLVADSNGSENTVDKIADILSNGFKIRNTSTAFNGSGNTIIYMAFAEEPLVGDNPATAR